MEDENAELQKVAASSTATYQADLQFFENGLMKFIDQHGLPTENVLVPVAERYRVFKNVDEVLGLLSVDYKAKSVYVSKLIAAAASGLFDAALNYLWDETIYELRKRVSVYDLEYFYDLAVTSPEKRKRLSSAEDLSKIDDNDLIRGATELGLISELGFKHLDYVRYMRNWASAAHPNQNQITGLQLIAWFETCIKEVITLPETNQTAQIKTLLANVKTHVIDKPMAQQISGFFVQLPSDQSANLMSGFFGIYTNDNSLPAARDNIKLLSPALWPFVPELTRNAIGVKYGQFTANNDAAKAKLAREFLDGVGGASYIPETIRAAEIGTAIDELLAAHRGWNNFNVEPSFARRLASLVGDKGIIPSAVLEQYIEGLVEVFLTNGHGTAWSADEIYKILLAKLDATQALLAVLSFRKLQISSKLQFNLGQQKFRELVAIARGKITAPQGVDILDIVDNYKAPLSTLRSDTVLMKRVTAITKSLGF
jgi:hypothetical protein